MLNTFFYQHFYHCQIVNSIEKQQFTACLNCLVVFINFWNCSHYLVFLAWDPIQEGSELLFSNGEAWDTFQLNGSVLGIDPIPMTHWASLK